jgi:uncharacterized protein (TIGR02996 family)
VGAEISVGDERVARVVSELIARPAAAGIEDLDVTMGEGFDRILPLLVAAPSLRRVALRGGQDLGDGCTLSLLSGHPGLRRLEVAPGILDEDDPLCLPALEELVLDPGVLTGGGIRTLARADLPALRRLELHLRSGSDGNEATYDDLEVLCARSFPSLRELSLCDVSLYTDELARLLEGASLTKGLELLEVPEGGEDLQQLLEGKLGGCRVRTDPPFSDAPKPGEAAILRDPEDEAAYLVLADWLEERGDPQGELIRVQQALAAKPTAALRRRERQLLRTSTFLEGIPVTEVSLEVTWHLGHLRTALLSVGRRYDWVVGALLAAPIARYLRELTVNTDENDRNRSVFADVLDSILDARPACLRKLTLETTARHEVSLKKLVENIPTLAMFAVPPSVTVKGQVRGVTVVRP